MNNVQDAADFFKALSHPARVLLVRLTWERARSGEELCKLLNLSAATVSHHLAQLDDAGLITAEQSGHHRFYRAHQAAFAPTLAQLVRAESKQPPSRTEAERYRAKVIQTFLKGGKLSAIPAQRKKRDVILEVLVNEFEVGREYPEREVNELLGTYHPDFFTLRRELIMRGLLERGNGVYWRPTEQAAVNPLAQEA
ncbi:metalloregulator ArsR/SmtB family transcription factor [Deinococcus detaillensis]|uniref:Metalloregulator ArsR/SmtB family transcription factor n=1 Tax=Deinococcus detaillensis TaxID=2592048 RepID=A0A553UGS8_9DEIO|nr:metalloregulator ArsR/SmtB family transcription factor [Deinococcus detaillensis]TSA79395.1 metalloregulator ArsR/SmtB family transcription factor [Deinococcus detaillensis]